MKTVLLAALQKLYDCSHYLVIVVHLDAIVCILIFRYCLFTLIHIDFPVTQFQYNLISNLHVFNFILDCTVTACATDGCLPMYWPIFAVLAYHKYQCKNTDVCAKLMVLFEVRIWDRSLNQGMVKEQSNTS